MLKSLQHQSTGELYCILQQKYDKHSRSVKPAGNISKVDSLHQCFIVPLHDCSECEVTRFDKWSAYNYVERKALVIEYQSS